MAVTRSISTRLVMENEAAYRASIKQINQEYKTLDSSLRLVESTFKAQQNTLDALEAKNRALTDVIAKQTEKLNAEKTALSQMQELQAKYAQAAEDARAKLKALADGTDDATKETKEYQDQVKAIQAEIAKYEAAEKGAADKVELHTQKMNGAQTELNNLNGKLSENEKLLDEAKASADGCAKSIDEYGKEVKEAAAESEDFGDKSKASIDTLATALAAAGIAATIKQIGEALVDCAKASIDFESAFAGVKKTVDASDEVYTKLSDSIKEMATRIPATTTELAGIMEMAGQLGVRGTDNLIKFTETIAALGVSTNLTRENAATMLAQFANITGMPVENIDRLASVIVDLGNNFATSESKIVDMAQRLASAFAQIGMSEAEIMGFAAALSSVGINAEAGGTAFSKLGTQMKVAADTGTRAQGIIEKTGMSLRELQLFADQDSEAFKGLAGSLGLTSDELMNFMSAADDLEKFAAIAGMTGEQFTSMFNEDAAGAMMAFIGGLNQIEQSGGSAIVALDELGITEARMSNAVRSAANGLDTFVGAQKRANTAWEENSALQKEAQQRYATTESKITMFKNAVNNVRIAIGDELNPAIKSWVGTGTDVAKWAEGFIKAHPEVVHMATALVAATTAFVGVAGAIAVVNVALKALTASVSTTALVVAAIAAVGAALISLATTTKNTDEDLERLKGTIDGVSENIKNANATYEVDASQIESAATLALEYIGRLEDLEAQASMTEDEQAEYARTVEKLQQLMPGLNTEIDQQTGLLKDGAGALRDQVGAWKELAIAQAQQELYTKLIEAQVEAEWALTEAKAKHAEKTEEVDKWEKIRTETLEKLSPMMGKSAEDLARSTADAIGLNAVLQGLIPPELQDEFGDLITYLRSVEGSIETATGEAEAYAPVVEEAGEASAAAGEKADQFADAMLRVGENAGVAAEGQEAYAEGLAEFQKDAAGVQANMDDLIQKYEEAYGAAKDNIESTMGLFDKMEIKTDEKVTDMIKALESQITYMDTYAENIRKAAELGIDQGLLLTLSDGSVQSAQYLAAIVEDGGKNMGELNEKFRSVSAGKDDFATLLAAMSLVADEKFTEVMGSTDKMVENLNQQGSAYANTNSTVQGILSALTDGQSEVNRIAAEIASTLAGLGGATVSVSFDGGTSGSHAAGKEYIPYDGYIAELHKGEMVLTALQAKAFRAERFANYGMQARLGDTITNSTALGGIVMNIYESKNANATGRAVTDALRMRMRHKGVVIRNG